MRKERVYTKHHPRYYIRMMIDGEWHVLMAIHYEPTRPIWIRETALNGQTPKLYKTLVHARNTLDIHGSMLAKTEVAIWKAEDGQTQAASH